jgi:hypothetical protein
MKNSADVQESRGTVQRERQHWIIQPGPETPADFRAILQLRGARFVRSVPDTAWMVVIGRDTDLFI